MLNTTVEKVNMFFDDYHMYEAADIFIISSGMSTATGIWNFRKAIWIAPIPGRFSS